MKTETLTCDRCGKSATTGEEKDKLGLGNIDLGFRTEYFYPSQTTAVYADHAEWHKQWCRACRKELGILEEELRKQPDAPVPTLEDMVREIVRSELPLANYH